MEQVRRWDTGTVGQVERTDQGYLRAPALITKTGVFAYKLPGGKIRRELRLPEEVFSAAAMRSFGIAPLTVGHPRKPDGEPIMLNARNTAKYQVGSVVEPRQDGDHVAAYVQITDADAIEAAENGRRQLSCGYSAALEQKAGVTQGIPGIPDGLHYDAIQRNIRGNHVALVSSGRAGSTVQLRLDQADGFQIEDTDDQWRYDRDPSTIQTLIFARDKFTAARALAWAKEHGFASPKGADETEDNLRVRQRDPGAFLEGSFRTIELAPGIKAVIGRPAKNDSTDLADSAQGANHIMETKITVDGVSYEATPQVAQAVAKLDTRIDELSKALAEHKQQLETERARADAAEESLAAEKKAHADALAPDKVRDAINARLALERAAAPILGSETKLDGMADADIKAAVVLAAAKDKDLAKERLDGCDAAYLQARYDAAIEGWVEPEQRNDALANTRKAGLRTDQIDSADAARERMIQHNREIGTKALKAS